VTHLEPVLSVKRVKLSISNTACGLIVVSTSAFMTEITPNRGCSGSRDLLNCWATLCKTVRPIVLDHCLSVCPVCDVVVL